MELYDSMLAGSSAQRLQRARISIIPAQHSWVGLPGPLVNSLLDMQIQLPLAIRLRVIPSTGHAATTRTPTSSSSSSSSSKPRYVAWAGACSSTPGTIELAAGLASALQLPAGTTVAVEILAELADAAAVVVEPVGSADWEVVELNAELLEDMLLQQAGVMCVGQPFPLWARQARVMLKITSIMHWPKAAAAAAAGPRATSHPGSSSSKPMVIKDVARITQGTELHIAPKPRVTTASSGGLGPGPMPLKPDQQQQQQPQGGTATAHNVQQQQQQQQQPVWLRVRELGYKHLLDTTILQDAGGSSSSSSSGGGLQQHTDGNCNPAAAAVAAAVVKSWTTTAVFVSAATAQDLGLRLGSLVQIHGSTAAAAAAAASSSSSSSSVLPLQSLVVLLLLDADVPWGHVAVAPPLQQCLGVAAHQYIKVQPLQQQQQQQQRLPVFILHPLLPAAAVAPGSNAAGAVAGDQRQAAAAAAAAAGSSAGGSSAGGSSAGGSSTSAALQRVAGQQHMVASVKTRSKPRVSFHEIEEIIDHNGHTRDRQNASGYSQQEQQQQQQSASKLDHADSFTGLDLLRDIVASWVTKPVQLTMRLSYTLSEQLQQQQQQRSPRNGSSLVSQQQQQQEQARVQELAAAVVDGCEGPGDLFSQVFQQQDVMSDAIAAWLKLQALAAAAAAAGIESVDSSTAAAAGGVVPCCGPLLVHFSVQQQQQQHQQEALIANGSSSSSSSDSSTDVEHLMLLLPHQAKGSSSSSSSTCAVLPARLVNELHTGQMQVYQTATKPQQQQQQQQQQQLDIHVAKALIYNPAAAAVPSAAAAHHNSYISHMTSNNNNNTSIQSASVITANHPYNHNHHQHQQQLNPADFPWLNPAVQICLDRLNPRLSLLSWHAWQSVDLPMPGGPLICGSSDSGRSWLLQLLGQAAAQQQDAHVLKVSCKGLAGQSYDAAISVLTAAAAEVSSHCPGLLLLDDLDLIAPAAANGDLGQSEQDQTTATHVAWWLADIMNWSSVQSRPIAFAATCSNAAAVPACLRAAGCFDTEVKTPAFGAQGRAALLLSGFKAKGLGYEGGLSEIQGLAGKRLEGFDAKDLQVVVDRAVHAALRRQMAAAVTAAGAGLPVTPRTAAAAAAAAGGGGGSPRFLDRLASGTSSLSEASFSSTAGIAAAAAASTAAGAADAGYQQLLVTAADLDQALSGFTPAAFWRAGQQQQQQQQGGVQGWQDVGGLAEAVAALKEVLLLPAKYGRQLAAAPLRLRTGLLLFGPPGCGKTHVVGAAVAATGARLISVKGPELLNKYIGQSEAAVRDLFSRAAAAAPCVLFFDEFDAIAPPRGHDSTGVTDRVVNQLLTELDGVEGLTGVAVLAATSRPDLIDAALLRPGRLDRMVHCGMPDESERLAILTACARKLPLPPDVNFTLIAQQTVNFTSADVSALLSEAQLLAIHEKLDRSEQQTAADNTEGAEAAKSGVPVVSMQHLQRALAKARPSLPPTELRRLAGVYARFQQGRDPGINNRQLLDEGEKRVKHATLA